MAGIEPLLPRRRYRRRRRRSILNTLGGPWVVLLGIVISGTLGITGLSNFTGIGAIGGGKLSSCDIKGNVSSSGERIYHAPGQKYYGDTVVSASRGERWFCSEAEARAAGWRPSRR